MQSEAYSAALLKALVVLARRSVDLVAEPQPGDLVVETTLFRVDPDAIGFLVGHDDAPYGADDPLDGSVPMREVWDVLPLNPAAKLQTIGGEQVQRWDNATFHKVHESVHRMVPELAMGSNMGSKNAD